MKHHESRNLAASVHARLLNHARGGGRSFNDLAQLYAMERFLYRLSRSKYADRFVLKGALLMRVWDAASFRTTRDIDLLGNVANQVDTVALMIREICEQEVEPDGLVFDSAGVRGESIVEDADYEGIRISFRGSLGNMRLAMQIDVGFGDQITPAPRAIEFPTLLNLPAPRLMAYPPETVVAEKLHAMLLRGEANSRMKDFHDIRWMSRHFPFDGPVLANAISRTCKQRGTVIPPRPTALTPDFATSAAKAAQWRAFRRRIEPTECPDNFENVVDDVAKFLQPVVDALSRDARFDRTWQPTGPWQ